MPSPLDPRFPAALAETATPFDGAFTRSDLRAWRDTAGRPVLN
jgi:hypothetical protein